jgi:hydroxymethylbilane synthase
MSPAPSSLIIATRGSKLALAQVEIVSRQLRETYPDLEIEMKVVKTTGDTDQRPFSEIGGKGLFTTEVERELLAGTADVAVHSAKDLTAELAEGCSIIALPARASVHDVVIGGTGASGEERLGRLPAGAKVGTSSLRRRALLLEARPDVDAVEFRGNVDTRLRKVKDGEVDVAIIAAAGIERLGVGSEGAPLDMSRWLPAPAQGAIAVEALSERDDLRQLFAAIDDAVARATVTAERSFARVMEGGCSVPLGCRAQVTPRALILDGFLGLPDGSHSMRDRISGGAHEAAALGAELAKAIISCGGREILDELQEFNRPPVPEP